MMIVCKLTADFSLYADTDGHPWIRSDFSGLLSPVGCTSFPKLEAWKAIDRWMRQSDNDCLRARGDPRWQAACEAEMQCRPSVQEGKQP